MKYYRTTVKRNSEGRYVVRLQLKPNTPDIWVGSYSLALKMLTNLEHKFQTDFNLQAAYSQTMQEYLDLGHIQRVSLPNHSTDRCFFLPHHGVIKESSTTTRLRTVFNAAARVKGGNSLNDFLFVGPNLLAVTMDLLTHSFFQPTSKRCSDRSWYRKKINAYKPLFGEGGDRGSRIFLFDNSHL